jgi:hypothetical protein
VTAATLPTEVAPPVTVRRVTAAPLVEEPYVSTTDEPPPIVLTGDDETDEALAMLRSTTRAIHEAQDRVAELSDERKRLVLFLRRRGRVTFRRIAEAVGSTDQTIYKINREARQDEQDRADQPDATSLGYPDLRTYRQARLEARDAGAETPAFADWTPIDDTDDEPEDGQ